MLAEYCISSSLRLWFLYHQTVFQGKESNFRAKDNSRLAIQNSLIVLNLSLHYYTTHGATTFQSDYCLFGI